MQWDLTRLALQAARRILGGVGEGFGRFLGRVWAILALLDGLFGVIFWYLYLECSPEGLLKPPGVDF